MGRRRSNKSVFQAHLPFKSRIPARQKAISFAFERQAVGALSVVFIIFILLYSYFVMLSVSHVVVREEVMLDIEKISSDVARLERKYLAGTAEVTESRALANGYTRPVKQTFVERKAVTLTNAR